jgi:hypothetical protein
VDGRGFAYGLALQCVDDGAADGDAEPLGPDRRIRAALVTIVGIGLLLGAGVMAVILSRSWRRRVEMAELGTVSEQWLTEQRANDGHYSG